jgi:hypothetical protein
MASHCVYSQEKTSKLSNRYSTIDSLDVSPKSMSTYTVMLEPLKGLSVESTITTITNIKDEFKIINENQEVKNKEDRLSLKKDALSKIFSHPSSLLSLIWPIFFVFFIIWFLKQYKQVFINKINF